jgi:glycosidase
MKLPRNPLLYEINTAVYLSQLSQEAGRKVTLAAVSESEIARLAKLGVNAVWLMGIWQRSPKAIDINQADAGFMASLKQVLPDFKDSDLIGSAYSIKDYKVNKHFGGEVGLAKFRDKLAQHDIALLLDFVPNHTASDHPWTAKHPEYYIQGSAEDLATDPDSFIDCGKVILAKGRDPQYPAWSDVVQLNAFSKKFRQAAIETTSAIAQICDGVRCDMAMLMMNHIFQITWGSKSGPLPAKDFWEEIITAIKRDNPDFTFLAETYWDTEEELLRQGFDYCYDKTLYDLLLEHQAPAVAGHIARTVDVIDRMAHFIENHDEPRTAELYEPAKAQAAATIISLLPGIRFIHDGQLEGYKIRVPVQLSRRPHEPVNKEIQKFYESFLKTIKGWSLDRATWQLIGSDQPDVLIFEWSYNRSTHRVTINYSDKSVRIGHQELQPWQVILK